MNRLHEDLQVSHATVANWLAFLERLYALFRVSPFGAPRIRAVKKAQKHDHLDWSVVPNEGPRFARTSTDALADPSLRYLKARFPDCEAWQLSAAGTKDFLSPEGIRVCPALEFLRRLP